MTITRHDSMAQDKRYKHLLGTKMGNGTIVRVTLAGEVIYNDGTWTYLHDILSDKIRRE